MDEGTKAALQEQMQLGDALRRRIDGVDDRRGAGSGSSDSETRSVGIARGHKCVWGGPLSVLHRIGLPNEAAVCFPISKLRVALKYTALPYTAHLQPTGAPSHL